MKKVYCKYCKKYQIASGNCEVMRDNWYAPDAKEYHNARMKNTKNNCTEFEKRVG